MLVSMRELGFGMIEALRPHTRRCLIAILIVGLVIGLSGGLFLGWVVWPVGYAGEVSVSQALYVEIVADLFAYDLDQDRVRQAMDWPGAAKATCHLMTQATDEGRRLRFWTLLVVMGEDCGS